MHSVFVACQTVFPHGMDAHRLLRGKGIILDLGKKKKV